MHVPIRTCVGCRRTAARAELLRHVVIEGRVVADPSGSAPGRGSWLHDDAACLEQALRRGAFSRSQRRGVDASGLRESGDLTRE